MNNKVQILANIGFAYSNGVLKKDLCKDYIVQIKPENNWSNSDWLYIYLFSNRFAKIMHHLFTYHKDFCSEYMPRKLIKDNQDGCLALVMMRCDEPESKELIRFESGGEVLDIDSFSRMIDSMCSPEMLSLSMCCGAVGSFMFVEESVWVYLYLSRERGLSNAEIMKEFNEPCSNFYKKIKKPLDLQILDLYSNAYKTIQPV